MSDIGIFTVPCELCGTTTFSIGTKRCDRCWELERRIEVDPKLAARILELIWAEKPYLRSQFMEEQEAANL
jgi:hypothetical protein